MAKFEIRVQGDFQTILTKLNKDITSDLCDLVDESNYEDANIKMAVRVYDKYFVRNGNRASLSVNIVDNGYEVFISAIGAGGGRGGFFNFSLGAESALTNIVVKSISQMGYGSDISH
jgi:hypothetical protein